MLRKGARTEVAVRLAVTSALAIAPALAQSGRTTHNVTAVKHWNASGVTKISIEVSGEFEYRSDHLHDPERVYFDILNARPKFEGKRLFTEDIEGGMVKRIRVAETSPDITRVVFDLTADADVKASVLTGPNRLMIELRAASPTTAAPSTTTPPASAAPVIPVATTPIPIAPPAKIGADELPAHTAPLPAPSQLKIADPVKTADPVKSDFPKPDASASKSATIPPVTSAQATPPAAASSATTSPVTTSPATTGSSTSAAAIPKAARHTSNGDTSLVRALGLKLQRVVIDPGHGGHDDGTQGPKGLLEKDLVLDVSLRLGKLIEDRMGAEVIYTRSDDTFIPLEGRTALANEKKADLFLSIHANSSPVSHITGVETYYLNFTDSKDAMETASRENAGSQQSIFDLRDLIQKISLHDKASESRDFAERIQAALFAFSSKTFPNEKNRGVKKAPFVVLIGANMPSVLAEIGFVTNSREETLLKKPEYRQKLAEALYKGVSKYAESLSHFQVAAN